MGSRKEGIVVVKKKMERMIMNIKVKRRKWRMNREKRREER